MDFVRIVERTTARGITEVYPDFVIGKTKDLMIRGKGFYAIWDDDNKLWSTNEYDVQRLVDAELDAHVAKMNRNGFVEIKYMGLFSTNSWTNFRNYMNRVSDNFHQLDERITYQNTEVKKTDYRSRRLPYPLEAGSIEAYNELMETLYLPEERAKIEWAIGAVLAGEARDIQKFLVFYGDPGTGKGTVLNIIQKLFPGYYTAFEAKALTSNNNAFSTEVFRSNPLVAIQHDGDLSKIEDNTKLNSIVSHEDITMNEKYKPTYTSRVNAMLFLGSNKPVKISDAKSGIIRRLIDVHPAGKKIPIRKYQSLVAQVDFELGAIAAHCIDVYGRMGKNYYAGYRPVDMMFKTDVFFNFIEEYFDIFERQDNTTLTQAYGLYKKYCENTLVEFKLPMYKFREELKNYFEEFKERENVDGARVRNFYNKFAKSKFVFETKDEEGVIALVMDSRKSIFDETFANYPSQYANSAETPSKKWSSVTSVLSDLDTTKLHYVKPPQNHIVIDFDLADSKGEKSVVANMEAAAKWPPTYSEYSKSGKGVHLHYTYKGDATELSRVFAPGIEIKVFTGDSSLRRKLTKCNSLPIAEISSGLPLRETKVINKNVVMTERSIRHQIAANLTKSVHPGTKPSVDFIKHILDEAYANGVVYDVSDLRNKVLTFAANSTHQSDACIKLVNAMHFQSENAGQDSGEYDNKEIVFFDVEVFPNLFIVCWKVRGSEQVSRMINPTPKDVEELMRTKLVGFYCRQYDNHILYARLMGYSNYQLFQLSQKLITSDNRKEGKFNEAYAVSYTDIYDFSSVKKSLKRWEIDLGIAHKELGIPWDEDVPEKLIPEVVEYCVNDVLASEAVFEARYEDFVARQILSELSGLTVNDSTQQHTARIIFGSERKPQTEFVYTDLSEMFPGYEYSFGKSTYKGVEVGEGGWVDSTPGMYENVGLLDVVSMHPTSIHLLNLFGPYTEKFWNLVLARIAIKRRDYKAAVSYLGTESEKYFKEGNDLSALAYALKIVINIVYGLTSAKFENPFRDKRNVDNIVAKRGALFMVDLKEALVERGYEVIHIKTDSVKIANITAEAIEFVTQFGLKYGYTFEHETTYKKLCLVNDAVYIAKDDKGWTAVGAQFAEPFVFKTLFSKEPLEFLDLCVGKTVTTALYLDYNERLPEGEHDYHFIGRSGLFTPVIPGCGGGELLRINGEKYYSATGAKGYRWVESEMVNGLQSSEIDLSYFQKLADDAVKQISKYGDFEQFTN